MSVLLNLRKAAREIKGYLVTYVINEEDLVITKKDELEWLILDTIIFNIYEYLLAETNEEVAEHLYRKYVTSHGLVCRADEIGIDFFDLLHVVDTSVSTVGIKCLLSRHFKKDGYDECRIEYVKKYLAYEFVNMGDFRLRQWRQEHITNGKYVSDKYTITSTQTLIHDDVEDFDLTLENNIRMNWDTEGLDDLTLRWFRRR